MSYRGIAAFFTVACALATPSARAPAQYLAATRFEVAVSEARGGPSNSTAGAQSAWGPSVAVAVHRGLLDRVLLGVEAGIWRASENAQTSTIGYALVTGRLYLPGVQGLSVMLGAGYIGASFDDFQRAATVNSRVSRPALGIGLGYEPWQFGPSHVGLFVREINSLEASSQFTTTGSQSSKGSVVITQLGISIAWP